MSFGDCARSAMRLAVLALVAAAVSMAGCGDAREAASVTRPPEARAPDRSPRHGRLVIERAELGSDWSTGRSIRTTSCDVASPFTTAKRVISSPSFEREHTLIQQRVGRFADDSAARRGFDALRSAAATSCLLGAIRRHMEERAGGASDPLMEIRRERPFAGAVGTRYHTKVLSPIGLSDAYIDVVLVHMGPLVSWLVVVAGLRPLDQELFEGMVARIASRMERERERDNGEEGRRRDAYQRRR